jgi:DNA repair protein RecN (Recombination protein N)
MLQKLVIKNYAIIDHLLLEPDSRLNTITGETGAGKSIILGALSLILGERADTSILINKSEKSIVEGHFDISNNEIFKAALSEADIDIEPECVIRREISASGKTRAFINDTPVTLSVLQHLSAMLVDLQQQFGHLALDDDSFQMEMVDAVAQTHIEVATYSKYFKQHRQHLRQLTELRERRSAIQKEADYKQYLFDELKQAAFLPDEIEQATVQLKQYNNAEKILAVLQQGRILFAESEQPILNEIKKLGHQLQGISDLLPEAKQLQQRLNSAWEELKDLCSEFEKEESKFNPDPEMMELLQQRVDLGYKLFKKHSVNNTAELLDILQKLGSELIETGHLNETIEKLAEEEAQIFREMMVAGKVLSEKRKAALPDFIQKMNSLLVSVGMKDARFNIELTENDPSPIGINTAVFLLDANKSGIFQPVHKSASGGEMSRIMLCIKSLTAEALSVPTLIFDEVDAGISGEAARQVAELLRNLSHFRQVICITHQPQVAARGYRHFFVYKEGDNEGRLSTKIRLLEHEERIFSIARMVGGELPTAAALNNARELIGE